MKQALEREAPGAAYSFMQPIEMRMQELMEAGVRADVAVKLSGDNLDVLRDKAQQIARVVQAVPGAADVRAERVSGLPYLRVKVKRAAIARHGLDARDVLDEVEAIGGKTVGQVFEGNRRFALQVRIASAQRATLDDIGNGSRWATRTATSSRSASWPRSARRKARRRSAAKTRSGARASR